MADKPPVDLTRHEIRAFCATPPYVALPAALVLGGGEAPLGLLYTLYSVFMAIAGAYALAMLVFLPLYVALKSRGWTSFVRVAAVYIAVLAAFQALYFLMERWLGPAAMAGLCDITGSACYSPLSDAGALVCLAAFWICAYKLRPGSRRRDGPPPDSPENGAGAAIGGRLPGIGERPAVQAVMRGNKALLARFAAALALAALSAAASLADPSFDDREARIELSREIMRDLEVVVGGPPLGFSSVPAFEMERLNASVEVERGLRQHSYLEGFAESRDFLRGIYSGDSLEPPSAADGSEDPGSAGDLVELYAGHGYSALDRKLVMLGILLGWIRAFVWFFVIVPVGILLLPFIGD